MQNFLIIMQKTCHDVPEEVRNFSRRPSDYYMDARSGMTYLAKAKSRSTL